MASEFTSSSYNPPSAPLDSASRVGDGEQPLKSRVCRYFSSTGTCRAGNSCSFLHNDETASSKLLDRNQGDKPESMGSTCTSDDTHMVQDRKQALTQPIASRVMSKPVTQAQTQDPREFEVGQIRRRFSPKESRQPYGALLLKFSLRPSDPDFPFEMSALECSLSVPAAYPKAEPSLRVGNQDIPRGFALNVESGFDGLVEQKPDATLLELVKALDRNLEAFLSAPKADTIKLVPNKDTRHLANPPVRSVEPATASSKAEVVQPMQSSISKPIGDPAQPTVVYSTLERAEAAKRRETEVRQLEARMGRLPLYKKSGDGIAYTLHVEPRRRKELPTAIQAVKCVQIFVPLLYPLQPCRIQLLDVDPADSKAVQKGFELKASEQKEMTLMGHINSLAQNMHIFAKTALEEKMPMPIATPTPETKPELSAQLDKGKGRERRQSPDRSHIQYISRPLEWTIISREDVSGSDSDSYDYSYDSGDEDNEEIGEEGGVELELKPVDGQPEHEKSVQNPERGTAISFPFIELYGIELLEIVSLNITVKCERCKDLTEIKNLKNGASRSESCKKCATPFSAGFRRDLVHAHGVRAGFLDLEGCTVVDMLPSAFIPTCSQCSTAYQLPGIISVQGETTSNVCRECHQKFTFKIPSTKFLRISQTDRLPPAAGPRKRKEVLGLVSGTELPKRGRCRHYTKSYRWFRFSCCQKVYACDKCHDETEEHPNEWANRMICGFCSREGNYRPEDCGVCHNVLVGKKGGGFWEGGKGTRDKVVMSRKDPRKYKRIGTSLAKQQKNNSKQKG